MQYGTGFGAMWFRKERRCFKENESIDESQAKFYAYGADFGAMWFRKERCRFKEKNSVVDKGQAENFMQYGTDFGAMWARLFLVKASEA